MEMEMETGTEGVPAAELLQSATRELESRFANGPDGAGQERRVLRHNCAHGERNVDGDQQVVRDESALRA
jgi:hypothetical protein